MKQFELTLSEDDLDLIVTALNKFSGLIEDLIKKADSKDKVDWLNVKYTHITDLKDDLRSVKFMDN